jgi:hypothetical protein
MVTRGLTRSVSAISAGSAVHVFIVVALLLLAPTRVDAQQGRGAPPGPPPTAQASAPLDLIGYWVSVVSEDWLWRMITPPKGDVASIPLNPTGRKVADAWDLARDNANGDQCKAFGAAAVMRLPGRLRISWQDANTLKVETDAGIQTRLFHFGGTGTKPGARSLQGFSVATWETGAAGGGGGGGFGTFGAGAVGGMKVVTTQLRPGYLRKNGVPYGENTVVTEYFDRHTDFGTEWFTVTTVVEDPQHLTQPFITSTHFKKEPDGSKWNPTACHTDPPRIEKPVVN